MIFKDICMCVWDLWSNFIKVCLSSVLGPLGIMCCFPNRNCASMFQVRFQYKILNLLQKCTRCCFSSCWNLGKISFVSRSPVWALGSCDTAFHVAASLEEQRFWQLWHTEPFSENFALGTDADGFGPLEQFPAAGIGICGSSCSAGDGALRSRSSERRVKGKFALAEFNNSIA